VHLSTSQKGNVVIDTPDNVASVRDPIVASHIFALTCNASSMTCKLKILRHGVELNRIHHCLHSQNRDKKRMFLRVRRSYRQDRSEAEP